MPITMSLKASFQRALQSDHSPARQPAAAAMILGVSVSIAAAGTVSTNFNVTAKVVNNCTVSSSSISFGNYDPTNPTGLSAQGTITAKCTKGDAISVALNQGANPAPGSTPVAPARRMTNGASNYLPYHIYLAAPPNKQEWGTGAAGRSEPSAQIAAGVGVPLIFTTYGSLPAGTNVPAGEYTDIVVAIVTF
jgi:spore coat protein U-like protein